MAVWVAKCGGFVEPGARKIRLLYPAHYQNRAQATGEMALLVHEAEFHYHSLKPQLAIVQELKEKYCVGKIREEIYPKCGR